MMSAGTAARDTAHVSPEAVWSAFAELRRTTPLVHNITNYVAMDLSANVLLAAGASPAMVHAVEEAGEFAGIASSLVVNIGTLSPPWVEAMGVAAQAAGDRGIPWVLDPVAVGATSYRTSTATELLDLGPTIVRGNASEILALAGAAGVPLDAATGDEQGGGRGVDSAHGADSAVDAAAALATHIGGVVAVTGEVDVVTDGTRTVRVAGGDQLVTKITAVGCSVSALTAGFATVGDDRLVTTAAALAVMSVAVERAAADASGPGSLRVRLLDELHTLDEKAVLTGVRVS